MTKTIVALYHSATDAETTVRDLSAASFTEAEIIGSSATGFDSTTRNGKGGTNFSLEAGATAPSVNGSGGILVRLRRSGVPEEDSHAYAEGVRRGGSLVIARMADKNVDRGLEIMSNYRPVDIDEFTAQWRSEGWTRYDESSGPYTGAGLTDDAATSMYNPKIIPGIPTSTGDPSPRTRQNVEKGIIENVTIGEKSAKPISLFYSYSHKDEDLRLRLQDHLAVLKWNGMIAEWNDRDIEAGAEWEKEIDRHLSSADIILLLISASFIASKYCWSVEVKKALERHESGEARVIPVILRPCRWLSTPFAKLQATPKDAKPVTSWPDQDAAFDDVVSKIETVVLELQDKL